jgi:hypothetical protein
VAGADERPILFRESKSTKEVLSEPEIASAAEAAELFFDWWPSSSFPSSGWPEVAQQYKRAHRILTAAGFLVVADPRNDCGDGRTWVLRCKPTDKLLKDADPTNLSRQCLESDGMTLDGVLWQGEMLSVVLSPPAKPVDQLQLRPASPELEQEGLRGERLREIYGIDIAARIPLISSRRGTEHELTNPNSGLESSTEEALGEAWKLVKQWVCASVILPPHSPDEVLAQSRQETRPGGETDTAAATPIASSPIAASINQNSMLLRGDTWEICYSGTEGNANGTIMDVDGMRYYALLISESSSGTASISAEDLVRLRDRYFSDATPGESGAAESICNSDAAPYSDSYQDIYEPANRMATRKGLDCTAQSGEVIDQQALDECREGIEKVDLELEVLKTKPNPRQADFVRMEELEEEKEQIADYIRSSLIPARRSGGTARTAEFSNSAERARKVVDNAMRRARTRMEKHDCLRALVEHLKRSVTIGRTVSYTGSPGWRIEGLPSLRHTKA